MTVLSNLRPWRKGVCPLDSSRWTLLLPSSPSSYLFFPLLLRRAQSWEFLVSYADWADWRTFLHEKHQQDPRHDKEGEKRQAACVGIFEEIRSEIFTSFSFLLLFDFLVTNQQRSKLKTMHTKALKRTENEYRWEIRTRLVCLFTFSLISWFACFGLQNLESYPGEDSGNEKPQRRN